MAKPSGGLGRVISDHHQAHHLLRRVDPAPAGRLLVIPLMGCKQQHLNMAAFKWAAGAIWALLLFAVQQLHFHQLVCSSSSNTPHSHSIPPPQMYVRRTQSTAVLFCGPFFYEDISLRQQ